MRDKITSFLEQVGRDYKERGVATAEIHQGHDVHAFYRLNANPPRVVYVQGYPGLSTNDEARVWARLMDYDALMAIRKTGQVSIGNEHQATVKTFPNFEIGIYIPYCTKVLEEKLEENVPELRQEEKK